MKTKFLIFVLMMAVAGIVGCDLIDGAETLVKDAIVHITSDGKPYPAYFVASADTAKKPGIVLVHSIRGFEQV